MKPDDQESFVAHTEQAAHLYNSSGSVAWEWALTWSNAFEHYFPRYTSNAKVRGFFTVNVPFLLPIPEFLGRDYKIFHSKAEGAGSIVVFAPNEFRGTTCPRCKATKDVAAAINKAEPGTVTHFYVTSDGK